VKYFFGLHIKRCTNLKIFGATFGIGGELPPLPSLATRLSICSGGIQKC